MAKELTRPMTEAVRHSATPKGSLTSAPATSPRAAVLPADQRSPAVGQPAFDGDFSRVPVHSSGLAAIESSEDSGQCVSGRTPGEFVGDVGRQVGTAVGNVFGSAVGALTGISISSTNTLAPAWDPDGAFKWDVGLNTTGRNGWIVQEINNTFRGRNAAGPLTTRVPTPRLWEAWAVDGAGNVTPRRTGTNDMWRRPNRGPGTEGHWSLTGRLYWTTTDPATQGFTPGGVPDAGILLSTTAQPPGLGIARMHRFAQGTWDSTGAAPTHTGSAGP
jgi:hypothetical protein